MDCCHTLFNLISNQRDRLFIFPFGSIYWNVERKYFQCIYFQFKHRIVLHYWHCTNQSIYVQVLQHLRRGQKSSLHLFTDSISIRCVCSCKNLILHISIWFLCETMYWNYETTVGPHTMLPLGQRRCSAMQVILSMLIQGFTSVLYKSFYQH